MMMYQIGAAQQTQGKKQMPMLWTRLAWFASFGIAVLLAFWMRSVGYSWHATLGVGAVVWVVLPFVILQLCVVFVKRRMRMHYSRLTQSDELAAKIADAVKGLPLEEQKAIAKRMIDESLK